MDYLRVYVNFLRRFIAAGKDLLIVFDCSNGTTGLVLKRLFPKAVFLNDVPDGDFPGHGPNPMAEGAMDGLKRAVRKHGADLGIIFDADGDRVFFVDDKGREAETDAVARLLIWGLKPKKVIADVRVGYLVRQPQLPVTSYQLLISKVGHYFIKKLMRERMVEFAAEKSGHYYFKKFFYCDSGILAAIEAVNAVSRLPYALSQFCDLLPVYYRSGEVNFKVSGGKRIMRVVEDRYKANAFRVSHLDGLSMEFKDAWFNLRISNTEPLLRLNLEAKTKEAFEEFAGSLRRLIESF